MLMRADDADLGRFMGVVAKAILGDPNPHLSNKTTLAFGTHGSLKIDLEKGTAYSHEEEVGGGVLWLIEREKKLQGSAAFEFMRQIGCDLGEPVKPSRIVATYDYTDENGDLLFQVCRFEPKDFRQRAPDGEWKVKGIRQVPYRLWEVIEALAHERTVAIVEGEKDADRLWAAGFPATTNAGGAGKWKPEFAQFFKGASVVIICDNDAAGRAHGDQVGASLKDVAESLFLLDLPNLPPKGDFSDWADAGGTRNQLYSLIAAAPIWAPRPEPFKSRFGAQRWEEIGTAGAMAAYSWLVENIIPLNEITIAYGHSGTGKSFNIFDLAMCVARGLPFNGHNVEQGLVVYVAAEAGKGFTKRKIAYAQHHKLDRNESIPFVLLTKRANFFQDDTDALALVEECIAITGQYGIPLRLVVIDTMSASTQGMDEISGRDQAIVRRRLLMLEERLGASIIVVHHKPKGGGDGPRGHGSQTADAETTIEYEALTQRKTPSGDSVFRATSRKQRESKSGIFWEFSLPIIEVGQNKWGNPETSCVAVPFIAHRATASGGFHATPAELLFLNCMFEAMAEHGEPPPYGIPASITKAVDIKRVRDVMKSKFISGDEDEVKADNRFRTAFKRAADALRSGAVVGYQEPLIWYSGKAVNGLSPVTFAIQEVE